MSSLILPTYKCQRDCPGTYTANVLDYKLAFCEIQSQVGEHADEQTEKKMHTTAGQDRFLFSVKTTNSKRKGRMRLQQEKIMQLVKPSWYSGHCCRTEEVADDDKL